ncbi:hypothetical protein [Tenacibaculum ovolyticum]|uniref:hypothetical protein n=1 Tax=Tenacibaculum ovolyticum TaxID=104270 RepID=UPI000428C740|nr:hypothetical protein [Tenacibaculum ovolyticum]
MGKIITIRSSIYLFSVLLFISCYVVPCNLDFGLDELNEKQEDSFFIGRYIVEKSFNNHLKIDNSIINLKKDGTIEMNNIPINVFDFMKDYKEVNVKGTWRQNFIENRLEDCYYLPTNLKFDKKDDIDGGLRTIQVYVKNNKPVLLIEFGDPDGCNGIRFIKQ